jgi:effector-binding domain-containing protein
MDIELKEVEPKAVISLSWTGSYNQTEDMFDELLGWLMREGHPYSEPPIGVYYDDPAEVDEEELEAEICVPVEERFEAGEGMERKELPGVTMAATVHEGPYDEIPGVYDGIFDWIEEQGYTFLEEMGTREVFLKVHGQVEVDEELLTEVQVPVDTGEEEEAE